MRFWPLLLNPSDGQQQAHHHHGARNGVAQSHQLRNEARKRIGLVAQTERYEQGKTNGQHGRDAT